MINRSLTLVASLAFAGLAFGSTTVSAQQLRITSSCPLGAEQFGGRCVNGHYYAPRQPVYGQQQRRVIIVEEAPQQRVYFQPVPRMHHGDNGAQTVFGLIAAIARIAASN